MRHKAVWSACLPDGSRMNREFHVRFCERPVVRFRRPTQPHISGKNRKGRSPRGARRFASACGQSCSRLSSNSANVCTIPLRKPGHGSEWVVQGYFTTTRYRETTDSLNAFRTRDESILALDVTPSQLETAIQLDENAQAD